MGEIIRRVRTRLNKSQDEFAEMLRSQRNSVSRYETGRTKPGVVALWRLHNLAEPDEKKAIALEIRRRVGRPAVLQEDGTIDKSGSIEALRPVIMELEKLARRDSELSGDALSERKRYHALLDRIFDKGDANMINSLTRRLEVFAEMSTWPESTWPAPPGSSILHKSKH